MQRPISCKACLFSLLALIAVQNAGHTEGKKRALDLFQPDEGMSLPFLKQTMKGLSHRFFDPETDSLRYQITAEEAVTRLEGKSVVFDVDTPHILYFDKEHMSIASSKGMVKLQRGKEGIELMDGVVGYFDTGRSVKFETEALEMSFDGSGHSKYPIRFTQKGVTLVGARSVFYRTEIPSEDDTKEKIAKVVVYGPGYAQFDRNDSTPATEDSPTTMTANFLVEFNGSASYSQLHPIVFFNCKPDAPRDRVILYGEGYILRCRELQVHALGRMKSWERLKASGDARYTITPGVKVLDQLAHLQKLNSIRTLPEKP